MGMWRAARAAGAVVALAFLLAGVPWLLLVIAHPARVFAVDWVGALTGAAGSAAVLALLSIVAWLAWAVVAVTTVLELVAVVSRQRVVLRVPGTGWLRPVVGALVLAAVAAPTVAVAHPPPAAAEPPPPAPVASVLDQPASGQEPPTGPRYVVAEGDELWAVAEQELGAGERWREIAALNPELGPSWRLTPGQSLVLPAAAAAGPDSGPSVVVVQRGDSLWRIAERLLGSGERWPEIHALNTGLIADPDELEIGWVLRLPDEAAGQPDDEPARQARLGVLEDAPAKPVPDAPSLPEAAPPTAPVPDAPAEETPTEAPPSESRTDPPAADPLPAAPTGRPSEEPLASSPPSSDPLNVAEASGGLADDTLVGEAEDPAGLVAPLGALLAGAVLAGVATRRRAQLLARAVGRRLLPVSSDVSRFWAALARTAERPTRSPEAPTPTTVVLGRTDDDAPVTLDVERAHATVLRGPDAGAAVASVITGLACAPWSAETEVVLVGGRDWVEALDDPRITHVDDTGAGVADLTKSCAGRRLAMGSSDIPALRADPETSAAWRPCVWVFTGPLTGSQLDALGDALALGRVGISVVLQTEAEPPFESERISVDGEAGRWGEVRFRPQLVPEPARRALLELFTLTGRPDSRPAPWWVSDDDLPPNVLPLPRADAAYLEERQMSARPGSPDHPHLLLLGQVELLAAAGPRPSRAVGQCMEYCAWLLAHPGATATAMAQDLLVAETTRRSNMSRLRGWLGAADDGAEYLPDAYSGRISLDPRVSSDWESFEALLSGGVNLASTAALRQALHLVRGEPLGSFAFQWQWAEQMRSDMVAMIVDAACVLADRAIDHSDTDVALWAVGRGRLAAPADDALATREIHALAVAGRAADVRQAVVLLNRATRAAGRDLAPELARRVQYAIHLAAEAQTSR